jgi:hypothetical protein
MTVVKRSKRAKPDPELVKLADSLLTNYSVMAQHKHLTPAQPTSLQAPPPSAMPAPCAWQSPSCHPPRR